MKSGLVSVSFRDRGVEEIVEECCRCGLEEIEWGGDVHVPVGDFDTARRVKALCDGNGIAIPSYGSYLRLGLNAHEQFEAVARTASELGASRVRVWAGEKGSHELSWAEYVSIVLSAKRICQIADRYGLLVCTECHINTATDDYKGTLKLIKDVACYNFKTYYQPNHLKDEAYNLEAAKALAPYVTNVHVFNWKGNEKMPLGEALEIWRRYLSFFSEDTSVMLEFVPGMKIDELCAESEALHKILLK